MRHLIAILLQNEAGALTRVTGHRRQTLRKFFRVRVPIAAAAEPARIELEHFDAECVRIVDHAPNLTSIDRYAVAPAIVRNQVGLKRDGRGLDKVGIG